MRGVDALAFVHWGTHHLGGVSGMPNSYWPRAHLWSLGRLSGALSGGSSFSSFSLTSWDEARREELPKMH